MVQVHFSNGKCIARNNISLDLSRPIMMVKLILGREIIYVFLSIFALNCRYYVIYVYFF